MRWRSATALTIACLTACAQPGRVSPDSPVGRGRALLQAERYDEALASFREGLALEPGSANALLGIGAAFEGLGHLDSARTIYNRLATTDLSSRVRGQLVRRQNYLTRLELAASARQAVVDEARLAQQPPRDNTIAVFPFRYQGVRDELRPLERGLSQILITDLGKISALTLLERQRVQFLLDELALAETGRVDPQTASRSGYMLQASDVVQGNIQDIPGTTRLQLDVNVVSTTTSDIRATGSATDNLQQLFDIEKQVLFELIDRLGVPITLAERQALEERPTNNLQAFLAYSRGLVAEDAGNYGAARAEYQAAQNLDPNFSAAASQAQETSDLESAATQDLGDVSELLSAPGRETSDFLADNINSVIPSGISTTEVIGTPTSNPPSDRNPFSDVGGNDEVRPPTSFGTLVLIIRRPQ